MKGKTNAMRMLEKAKIDYKMHEYIVDENDLSGVHIASQLNFPVERMFKTLVAHGDKTGYVVFCIPVAKEINLKLAASVTKNKKIEMVHVKDLLNLTGYIRGGCSPVGMKKAFPTYFYETAKDYETLTVSAGVRGCMLEINSKELCDFVKAEYVNICD